MSYNVSNLKVKKNTLMISVENVKKFMKKCEDAGVSWNEMNGSISFDMGEGELDLLAMGICEHCGRGATEYKVDTVSQGGDWSGTLDEVYEAFYRLTTGNFEAIQVWEGGDSINTISVNDGSVTSEDL